MTFDAYETSVESARPVELYHFTIGTTSYYYTSAPDQFLFGGNTYLPRQISRTNPVQSTEERRQQIEVTLPTEDDVCSRFVGVVPGLPMYLEISKYHRGDTGVFVIWSGTIVGASYQKQGASCVLRGVTTEAAFSRPIPKFKYQGLCNYVLFDSNCQVSSASFKHEDTCSAASGNTITVNNLSSKGTDWAKSGYVNLNDSDYRLVLSQSGNTLTLYLPFENDPVGETVKVFAGCDHSLTDCGTKFSNTLNYGGFPFVPELNPFIVGMD